jgi:acyl-CoA thioester hydrolase
MITTITFPVRYAETDRMGIVHHSNYPVWFEIGRTDFLRQLGRTYLSLEEEGLLLPLSSMDCKFKRPAKYGDEVTVKTSLANLTCVRMKFLYEVTNQEGELLAWGSTEHGCTDWELKPFNLVKRMPQFYQILLKNKKSP